MTFNVLVAVLLSFFICQSVKLLLRWQQYNRINPWVFLEDVGLPSVHAAVTVALATAVFYETGMSLIFVVTLVFTLTILNDAMKVKKQQGIQSELMARKLICRH